MQKGDRRIEGEAGLPPFLRNQDAGGNSYLKRLGQGKFGAHRPIATGDAFVWRAGECLPSSSICGKVAAAAATRVAQFPVRTADATTRRRFRIPGDELLHVRLFGRAWFLKVWGAHAPPRVRGGALAAPRLYREKVRFGEGAKPTRGGGCAPQKGTRRRSAAATVRKGRAEARPSVYQSRRMRK